MRSETTMQLKVGDKVKVIQSTDFPDYVGHIYTVNVVMEKSSDFACRIDVGGGVFGGTLMFENEIEKVPTVGQQLLFAFMDEVEK